MRTLCLVLPHPPKHKKSLGLSYAEQFLKFSPRISTRSYGQSPDGETFIFIDIKSTVSHFESEQALMLEAKELALQTYANVRIAIADNPWVAQALALEHGEYIGAHGEDSMEIADMPIRCLPWLEGVLPWNQHEVRAISTFFELIGFKSVREIKKFSIESLRERWGKTGGWLWKKLHLQDQQVISPLEPAESLVEYMHLDDPTYTISFLLYCIEINLRSMCLRLQGRGECAHKVYINLYCEYSNQQHRLEIHPSQPTRNLEVLTQLVEHRLEQLSLENPIRHFDLEIMPVPENIQQLDFFEPRERDQDKLLSLSSLLKQAEVPAGFFKLESSLWPEDSWTLTDEASDFVGVDDIIEVEGESYKIKPAYSSTVTNSPRPTRLLDQPKPMSEREVNKLHFLTPHPVERIEDSWWAISRGRDYYWAVSQRGQNLWVFKDHVEQQYYLHGYLD